ncbi:TIGR00296 family protein [Candidatus Woesearchaeota archaeon]|nr:TIGR00296 family protein [Candidatus Woesearchaeota archaeon]
MLTINQAKKLIKLARGSISSYFKQKQLKIPESVKTAFGKKQGVFVSLYINEELAGCIGFPEPTLPLYQAVIRGALGAAFEDPRFPPLKQAQFKNIRIELSVLTIPKEIEVKKPEEYLEKIKIGKDGLLVKDEFGSGLLLPQVPVEWKWDAKQFLNHTCMKAGLSPDCWDNMKRNIYKFQAQIFTEKDGKIIEKKFI